MVYKGYMFCEIDGKNASREVAVKSFKGKEVVMRCL